MLCCLSHFQSFLEEKKRKKEEARLGLYHRYLPPVLFCFSLFGFGLATATLLRYYIAYSLSLLFLSYISLKGERYIYTYLPDIAKYNKDPTIIPLITLPNRP